MKLGSFFNTVRYMRLEHERVELGPCCIEQRYYE